MYCKHCRIEATEDASFCARCGNRLAATQPKAKRNKSSATVAADPAILKPQLNGVGGWLGLLVVALGAIGPFWGGFRLFQAFEEAEFKTAQLSHYAPWTTYKVEVWAIFVFSAAFSMAAASGLYYRHRPSSVRFAILALWVIFPVQAVLNIIAIATTFPDQIATAMIQATKATLVQGIIIASIWTAYLLLSKRVKNTYYQWQSP